MPVAGKKDAYAHRYDPSLTVPLEPDSDPDFNPGVYVPEDDAKRKGKRTKRKRPSERSRQSRGSNSRYKRPKTDASTFSESGSSVGNHNLSDLGESEESDFSDMSDADEDEDHQRKRKQAAPTKKKRKMFKDPQRVKGRDWGPNPLLKYFDVSGVLSSEEEETNEPPPSPRAVPKRKRPHAESDEEQASLSSPCEQEFHSSPPGLHGTKTVAPPTKVQVAAQGRLANGKPATSPGPVPPENNTPAINLEEADTESESDSDAVFNRVRPESKSIEEASTESESDSDGVFASYPPKSNTVPPTRPTSFDQSLDTSDTESEDDEEADIAVDPQPKPAFPRPSSSLLSPEGYMLDNTKNIKVPGPVNAFLRSYQREGVDFLYRQYKEGLGGILGDDMGLGKTVQVIAFLSAIMSKTGTRRDDRRRKKHVSKLQDLKAWKLERKLPPADQTWPTALIIAPSTVVWNWEREFQTWGYFEVGCYMGKPDLRKQVLKDFKMGRLDVVITSHELARMDIEELDSLPWSAVFIDEAHKVKNPNSQITRSFHHFHCLRRFGLTGTAIQNSYNELYTILDWANPGCLGSKKDWKTMVNQPLTKGQSKSAGAEERRKFLLVSQGLSRRILPRFFLRRTKKLIEDQMPKKTDQVVFCGLAPKQAEIYRNIVSHERVVNILRRQEKCDCRSGQLRQHCHHPWDKADVFYFLSILIKLSNHVCLILPGDPNDTAEQTEAAREVCREFAFPGETPPKFGQAQMMRQYCGKWEALHILLSRWRADIDAKNKVLIFTKSVKLMTVLAWHLDRCGFKHLRLDGSVKQEDRMPLIDRFHEDEDVFVFLISTMAGGTGLNLTGANKVVIFDPNWNPAHDLQAMDRAFRFGQRRDVHVYRLLGAGSLEELIYARQVYKQQQMAIGYDGSIQTRYFEGVQDDPTQPGELFGLSNIFKLDEEKLATKLTIEQAHIANVDWALSHVSSSKKAVKKDGPEDSRVGAVIDSKADNELRGLGALLFDDSAPNLPESENDEISREFNLAGVQYTHFNDQMLVPTALEVKQAEDVLKTKKRNLGTATSSSKSNEKARPVWPPHRPSKKKKNPRIPEDEGLTPSERFNRRIAAIGATGHMCFRTPQEAAQFATYFSNATPARQQEILDDMDASLES